MKKSSILYPLIAACCFMLHACDLDYAPENTLVDEKVYKTERTAQAALMGAYVRLDVFLSGAPQDQNNYSNTGYAHLYGDIGTDNLKVRSSVSSFEAMEKAEYTSSEHDGFIQSVWQWGYNAIDMANNVIVGVEKYAQYADVTKRQFIAEAKFIRAYCYFQLLCMYGDKALLGNDEGSGVVMRLEPYSGYNPSDMVGRVTNAQVWKQIIDDLTQAIPGLSDEVPAAAQRIRANKAVARALLSRVYLYKGTYTNNKAELALARDYAAQVLANTGYRFSTLSTEFSTALFPSNEYSTASDYPNPTTRSEELLFFEPSRISTAEFPNGLNHYRKRYYYVPAEMKAVYDDNDVRSTYLIWKGSTTENINDLTTMKHSAESYCDVIYMRLSEVKLTMAETLARTANAVTDEALNQLNDVHQRAYPEGEKPALYQASDFASVDDFVQEVLRERRRELAYEGHYRWDAMRTNNVLGDAKLGAVNPARWNLPIPEYELRISYGQITQNSGYVE